MKKQLFLLATMAFLGACATPPKMSDAPVADRSTASWGDSKDGVYLTREIRNNDGQIGVLREFELMRNYSGKNIKGILIEVIPFNSYSNRTRLDVSLNGQTLDVHDIMVRQGRQHLYTDIDREVRDEVRELSLRYDPRQVSVQSITVLINEDRPWDRPGRPDRNDSYSQTYDRVNRRLGGSLYDLMVPREVRANYLVLEAQNAPVIIYSATADGRQIPIPGLNDPRRGVTVLPGYPVVVGLQGMSATLIRIQAEGTQSDFVALKATVSERGNDNRPGPGPGPGPRPPEPPRPVRVVESCTFARYDASGMAVVQNYPPMTAEGFDRAEAKREACRLAEDVCRRDLVGRPGRPMQQTCRQVY